MSHWVRTSRSRPCPVCGRQRYCTIEASCAVAHCMWVKSDKPCKNGGWIHPIAGDQKPEIIDVPPQPEKIKDVSNVAKECYHREGAKEQRRVLADQWRVRLAVLEGLRVGLGYDWDGRMWLSFPSRDGSGTITGITRRYADGSKRTMRGTANSGVFVLPGWWRNRGPIYIVEGASDTAIMSNLGLSVIGRPSNVGGLYTVRKYLFRRACGRQVIIVGERDRKNDRVGDVEHGCNPGCQGCSWCWPGKYGADAFAQQLKRFSPSVLLPPDGVKDVREWSEVEADLLGAIKRKEPERG